MFVEYWLLEESCRFCELGCLAFGEPRRASGGHPGGRAAEIRCWVVSLHVLPRCWSQRDRAEPGCSWFLGSVLHVCLAEGGWDAGLVHLFTQVRPPGWLVRLQVPSASSSCRCGCSPGLGCWAGQGKLWDVRYISDRHEGLWGDDLCSVWEVLTLKKLFKNDFFFLRCKFDWASCILSGGPTQRHCAAAGVSVVVTQVWLLLALRRPSPGVLSVSSSAQDGPTEKVPAQICAVLAEQRLAVRHHSPCWPVPLYLAAAGAADSLIWGGGAQERFAALLALRG